MRTKWILIIIIPLFLFSSEIFIIQRHNSVTEIVNSNSMDNSNRIYDSCMDFIADSEMNYADDQIFNMMKAAHDKIDFYGEFKTGDLQSYDYYKKKFKSLINNEVNFGIRDSKETYYLSGYNKLSSYKPETYKYLFFDMDSDRAPELCISYDGGIYIFKYIPDNDQYILWEDMESSYYTIIGSQKTTWESFNTRSVYSFYKLDGEGKKEYSVTYMMMRPNENYIYMASVPKHEIVPEKMKKQGYYSRIDESYYFRISEDQYKELSEKYFKATNLLRVMENAEEVTYTYEELWDS